MSVFSSFLFWKTSLLIFSFFSFSFSSSSVSRGFDLCCGSFCSRWFVIHLHLLWPSCDFHCSHTFVMMSPVNLPFSPCVRPSVSGFVCDTLAASFLSFPLPLLLFHLRLFSSSFYFLLPLRPFSSFFLPPHCSSTFPSLQPFFLLLHTSSSSSYASAALGRGRGWSRRTWAACCRCVTSGWTPASCTRCPCWPSARTSWWCGSSSAWPTSWPNCAVAERAPLPGATDWKRCGYSTLSPGGVPEAVPLACECVWN